MDNNSVNYNYKGIYLFRSLYNTIHNNTISENHDDAIYIEDCSKGNIFYENDIILPAEGYAYGFYFYTYEETNEWKLYSDSTIGLVLNCNVTYIDGMDKFMLQTFYDPDESWIQYVHNIIL